jgi:uncharacterized glyoxalase superfamily protein PhnB
MALGGTTPLLRIFDEAKARAFYLDYLGFRVDWEHRFEAGLPLYLQISRDGCTLHLTEHHGDCTPGAAVRVHADDADVLCAELAAKAYGFAQPAVERKPWGSRDLEVKDPFGNRLIFTTPR